MQIPFVTVDVFTDRKFGGNPLAVVPDATGLTSAQMQAIAGEFNLAETTFVLPPQDPAHTAEVCIFTPRAELPFAGHPNIGTAYVLAVEANRAGRALAEPLVFEEKAGLVRLSLLKEGASLIGARLTPPQSLNRGDDLDAEIIAAACSLSVSDIETANHQPCILSCGLPLAFVELKTRAALAAARPRTDVFTKHLPTDRLIGILLYVHDRRGGFDLQVRMFGPLVGVLEDAASGSPNVALGGLLATLRPEPDLKLAFRIGQGIDMGRPSLLEAAADRRPIDRRALRADDAGRAGGLGSRHGRTYSGHPDGEWHSRAHLSGMPATSAGMTKPITSPPPRRLWPWRPRPAASRRHP